MLSYYLAQKINKFVRNWLTLNKIALVSFKVKIPLCAAPLKEADKRIFRDTKIFESSDILVIVCGSICNHLYFTSIYTETINYDLVCTRHTYNGTCKSVLANIDLDNDFYVKINNMISIFVCN